MRNPSLAFPGRWSLLYSATIVVTYLLVSLTTHDRFDAANVADQKTLVLRLTTMIATVVIAALTVRIERGRRRRAVAAEAERAGQVLALEAQAREERRRVSREIHDGIAQGVYMLAIGLETNAELLARQSDDAGLRERMNALVRLAKQTLLETRNFLFDLEPVMAGQRGLAALARNQAAEFTAVSGIPVDVHVTGEERPLTPAQVGEVYRVVQEGLANIYKHAHAAAVTVSLDYGAEELTLRVADDGAGFDPAAPAGRGHGLASMRARAERLGGRFAVASTSGRGTRLTVTIPYAAEAPTAPPERVERTDGTARGETPPLPLGAGAMEEA